MDPDSSLYVKRIRRLTQALVISGAFNIAVLTLFLDWILREQPPSPYCELKPATTKEEQVSPVDLRGSREVIAELADLSFPLLLNRLQNARPVENGYTERDLALACLATFHRFDITRALPKDLMPKQKRLLSWKREENCPPVILTLYPELGAAQFEALIRFGKTEKWPFTSRGLFLVLQSRKKAGEAPDVDLIDTFIRSPEFLTVELLFKRSSRSPTTEELLSVILEGNWQTFQEFVHSQRRVHDRSDARRQKFLLDYILRGSGAAAVLLLKTDPEFAIKKTDDAQAIAVLQNIPVGEPLGTSFAKAMLAGPRGAEVLRHASDRLYREAGEEPPKERNDRASIARFIPTESKSPPTINAIESALPRVRVPLTSSTPSVSYTVQEGDSLWKISRKFGSNSEKLKEHNRLTSDTIKPGMILKIPKN